MNISEQQLNNMMAAVSVALQPLVRVVPMTAVEWADQNYYLPKESSYGEGEWKTLPFQIAIMNCMGNDQVRTVNLIKSARVGYTKMLLGVVGYFIEHKSRNSLLFQPTDSAAEDFMKSHVEATIRNVPCLKDLSPWLGRKHRDNTLTLKRFSSGVGFWCLGGAAAKNYREKSVDVVCYDELSSFEPDVEKEGSPTLLGDKRIEGSVWPKSIRGSTPKIKGSCQIEKAANESAHFMRFYVPCPHCGEAQYLKFGDDASPFGLKWEKNKPETSARYLGTGSQWSVSGPHIKPGKDFWFYVRSVNLVGKSAFVEVSGQPSNDGEGYLEFFREKIGKLHLAQGLWELIDNSQLADEMAEMKTTITETRNEITQTVSKTLEDQSATIQQIQRVQKDTNDDLAALYMLKVQKTKDGIPYVAGIGAGIEDTDGQPLSNILLLADRIAMINPESGNSTPLFVAQGNQLFMNDVFLKRLFAVSITSSGNPPAFSLTPEGKLTARNADISGAITANTGTLNNVTINENCVIRGKLSANQIEGDLVKTVGKAFPRNNSYASGTVTVTVYDDQGFDRQIIIPPVLFRGTKHQNFNSPNQQSYWYSTCKLQVLKNGVEIFHEPATDVSRVFSSVIDMPAGRGHVTLTFNVSSAGANNWTPTTYISDLLVVVMKKSTAGISIS